MSMSSIYIICSNIIRFEIYSINIIKKDLNIGTVIQVAKWCKELDIPLTQEEKRIERAFNRGEYDKTKK